MITTNLAEKINPADLPDRPIAYHRVFVEITGSVAGAVFLSQLVYWHRRTKGAWFYKTVQAWKEETGLTRYEQESARKRLTQLGILCVERRGLPARLYYRLDEAALNRSLSRFAQSGKQVCRFPQTSLPENSKQVCCKTTNKIAATQQTTDFPLPPSPLSLSPTPPIPYSSSSFPHTEINTEITPETTGKNPPLTPPFQADGQRAGVSPPSSTSLPGKPERKAQTRPKENAQALFETFWQAYPRKVGKKAAQRAFEKIKDKRAVLDQILKALAWQTRESQWLREGGRFIPHPATYLNQGRWEDEPPAKGPGTETSFPLPFDLPPDDLLAGLPVLTEAGRKTAQNLQEWLRDMEAGLAR